MTEPFFSVIIPTYNRKSIFETTIDSALAQTFKEFEIIVVDDGSTDNTKEFIEETYKDAVHLISISNSERGKARNTGTAYAKGKYIYFLDSDDILYPNHLAEAFSFIQKQNQPEWVFQEYEFIDKTTGKKTRIKYNRKSPVKALISKGNFMSCHGVFLRRDIALLHPFEENREMAGSEDYALWLKLAARYRLNINQTVTSALLQHDARSVFNFSPEKLIKRKELMLKAVLSDEVFCHQYSSLISRLKANTYSYLALHLAMISSKPKAFRYLIKSFRSSPASIFTRRSAAILKHLLR